MVETALTVSMQIFMTQTAMAELNATAVMADTIIPKTETDVFIIKEDKAVINEL